MPRAGDDSAPVAARECSRASDFPGLATPNGFDLAVSPGNRRINHGDLFCRRNCLNRYNGLGLPGRWGSCASFEKFHQLDEGWHYISRFSWIADCRTLGEFPTFHCAALIKLPGICENVFAVVMLCIPNRQSQFVNAQWLFQPANAGK